MKLLIKAMNAVYEAIENNEAMDPFDHSAANGLVLGLSLAVGFQQGNKRCIDALNRLAHKQFNLDDLAFLPDPENN